MSNLTQFTTGGVKSVQGGSYSTPTGGSNYAITISTINPAKAMVILNGGYNYGSYQTIMPAFVSLTATTLTVYGPFYYTSGAWNGTGGSWQVVEYY